METRNLISWIYDPQTRWGPQLEGKEGSQKMYRCPWGEQLLPGTCCGCPSAPSLGHCPHSVAFLGPAVACWGASSNLSCHPPARSSREGRFWAPFLPAHGISPWCDVLFWPRFSAVAQWLGTDTSTSVPLSLCPSPPLAAPLSCSPVLQWGALPQPCLPRGSSAGCSR